MLRCLTYIFFQFLGSLAAAQNFTTTTYTARDGLLDNHVTAITKDRRQLLWIGTPFGVNWFDGKNFYEPPINAHTGQLYITDFYKDNNNDIWTLTFYNGIYKFLNGKFINFLPQPGKLTSNRNNVFSMLQMDSSRYLVGTDENIFWFDGSSFNSFDETNPLLNKQINCLEKAGGTVLIGAGKELWQYQLSGKVILKRQLIFNDHKIYNISALANDVWISTNRGLYRYKNLRQISAQTPQIYLPGQHVFSVSKGAEGLWITAKKLYLLSNDSLIVYDESNGLPYGDASGVYVEDGITWLTTPKGLTRLNESYYQVLDLRATKAHSMIIGIEKTQNELWLGSYAGLTRLSKDGLLTIKDYKEQKLGYISWIKNLANGQVLTGTESGIMQITGDKVIKKNDLVTTKAFEDLEGNLWTGTIEGRLYKFISNDKQEIKLVNNVPDFIDAIFLDKQGFLWIGYRNNGIAKFQVTGTIAHPVKQFNETSGFPDLRIRCGILDKQGRKIFGTRTNGMFIFSATDDSYQQINTKKGLSGNWVKSISATDNDNIYVATNKGLNVVNLNNAQPVIRKLQLSVANSEARVNFVLAREDSVWIGTDSGLVTYFPRLDITNTTKPLVYLTQLTINGKNDSAFIPYSRSLENYTLEHNKNIIAIKFSGLDLQGNNLAYTYRLVGQDNSWSEPDSRNFVSYNLPPGKYEFQVYAFNKDGIKSIYPASLSFTILAPFWKTIWFLLICIAVVISLFYLVYKYRIAQVIKIEKMRGRISADLHDDLGSGLSRIKFLSETIKFNKNDDPDLDVKLDKISMYADEMSEKIGEIVWAMNTKNDKLPDLVAYMRSYTMEYLTNQGIICDASVPASIPDVIIDGETRRNIFLSLKEILFNIVKHAAANEVLFNISIGRSLHIIIHDNGVGIDLQNINKRGNGITNISDRMHNSGGTASFINENGTKVALIVPLHT